MTKDEVMKALASMGNEGTKRVLQNHGAKEPLFGVKVGDMKKIQKKIKKDYALSLALYDTGNYDAMYFAGLIADEKQMQKEDLQKWVEAATSEGISEYTVPWIASESAHGFEKGLEWIASPDEHIAAAGWSTLSSWAAIRPDEELDLGGVQRLAGPRRKGNPRRAQPRALHHEPIHHFRRELHRRPNRKGHANRRPGRESTCRDGRHRLQSSPGHALHQKSHGQGKNREKTEAGTVLGMRFHQILPFIFALLIACDDQPPRQAKQPVSRPSLPELKTLQDSCRFRCRTPLTALDKHNKDENRPWDLYLKNGEPFNGCAFDSLPAHQHTSYFFIRDGKMVRNVGVFDNGRLSRDFGVKDGENHGKVRMWQADGGPYLDTWFDRGQEVGLQRTWNREGKIVREAYFGKDGKQVYELKFDKSGEVDGNESTFPELRAVKVAGKSDTLVEKWAFPGWGFSIVAWVNGALVYRGAFRGQQAQPVGMHHHFYRNGRLWKKIEFRFSEDSWETVPNVIRKETEYSPAGALLAIREMERCVECDYRPVGVWEMYENGKRTEVLKAEEMKARELKAMEMDGYWAFTDWLHRNAK